MSHSLLRGEPLLVVVLEQIVEKVNGLAADEFLILASNESVPGFARIAPQYVVVLWIELDVVLFEV